MVHRHCTRIVRTGAFDKRKKGGAAVLLGVMLLVGAGALAGCGDSAEEGSQRQAGGQNSASEKPEVALIMKSMANEFFVTMAEGARAHHREHDGQYDLIVNGIKNETDLGQQTSLVEQMIARRVDAIVIAPADSKALVPVLKKAKNAGIVVVNIDNKLDAGTLERAGVHIPFVGPNNRKGARKVGRRLAQELSEGDEVAILEGIPTAFNAQQRLAGFREAMKEAGVQIVDVQSGSWEQGKANTVAAAMLRAHPGLDALLCSNDNMALGAAAAVEQAGLTEQVTIVGFDNIDAARKLIREGSMLATADQHASRLAVYGIEQALDILGGAKTPDNRETPVDVITVADVSGGT